MDELASQHVRLDVVWGGLATELHERVFEAAAPHEKLDVIERFLSARLVHGRSAHSVVTYAIDAFERDPAIVRIADVTGRTGLSHRRFLDLFTAEVGLTPKLFCRVRRFQKVLRRIRDGRRVEWADVALACGYYDQAHFIKDFQSFSGLNPSDYYASAGPHPNHVPLSD
jgi:AraC-like DNA-binding protein